MANPLPRRHSNLWWLKRRPYFIFFLREWSSLFIAGYAVLLLILTSKVLDGEAAYNSYVNDVLESPLLIGFHVVALLFAVLHTVTWFGAVPKGLALRRGEDPVPPSLIIGGSYAAWAVVTIVVAAVFLLD
ncbi:MAG: fumarate reductase subunit C [Dehalococcoidia bacterium]|jgi:fumarate reductase subunit C|nr:fumarate reductase subunit C [Dehalococcoidia bacterium]